MPFENLGPEPVVHVKRSARENKGVAPARYIEELEGKKPANRSREAKIHTKCATKISRPPSKPGPPGWKSLLMFSIIIAVFNDAQALTVDVCDCTSPQYAGVMGFEKLSNCVRAGSRMRHQAVQFELLVEQKESNTFSAQACRSWERIKTVKTGFLGNTDTTFQQHVEEVSPSDCWSMVQTGKCGDKALKKIGRVWSYHAEPQGDGAWYSTNTYKVLNCELEELTLEQECETCPVTSVVGEIGADRKLGYAVHAHRTFVWSDVTKSKRPCDMVRFPRRNGKIFNDTGTIRLRDTEHQMDFVMDKPRVPCNAENFKGTWGVKGEPKILVQLFSETGARIVALDQINEIGLPRHGLQVGRSIRSPLPKSPNDFPGTKPALTLEEYLPEHLQYLRDVLTEQENEIADAINFLDCKMGKDRLNTLMTLSSISGVLAARAISLDQCQSLQSFGVVGVVRQCRPLSATFQVDNTSRCGPQPKADNWTISHDGFVVLPYSSCMWKSSVVNFRGQPFHVRNGDRVMIKPNSVMEHKILAAHFKFEFDLSGTLLTAAMEKEHSLTFSLLSQLAGTMEDHGVNDVGSIVETVNQIRDVPSLFGKLKMIQVVVGSIVGLALLSIVTYILWIFRASYLGFWRRLWSRTMRRAPTVVVQGSHLQDTCVTRDSAMQPSINPVAAPSREHVRLYPDFATYQSPSSDLRVIGSMEG